MLIRLRWFDSTMGPATAVYTLEEALAEKMVVMETVGWLVAETEEPHGGYYLLAASQHGADWRGIQLIPKVNAISVHVWEEARDDTPQA